MGDKVDSKYMLKRSVNANNVRNNGVGVMFLCQCVSHVEHLFNTVT